MTIPSARDLGSCDLTLAREVQKRILAGEFPDSDVLWEAMDSLDNFFNDNPFLRDPFGEYPTYWEEDYFDDGPGDDPKQEEIDIAWEYLEEYRDSLRSRYDAWLYYEYYRSHDLMCDPPTLKEFSEQEAWETWEKEVSKWNEKSNHWERELWDYEAYLAEERERAILAS